MFLKIFLLLLFLLLLLLLLQPQYLVGGYGLDLREGQMDKQNSVNSIAPHACALGFACRAIPTV